MEVLDGVGDSAESLGKFCFHGAPDVVMTSSRRATVMFQASSNPHLPSRVGVSVTYTTVSFDGEYDMYACSHIHVCLLIF